MGTMTKWPVQKHTEHHKHGVYKDATYIKKKLFFCVFRIDTLENTTVPACVHCTVTINYAIKKTVTYYKKILPKTS